MERDQKAESAEIPESLAPFPTAGRSFVTTRRVSIADSAVHGRMELDAVARFLQDAGNDDTDDAGMAELGLAWVARKATIDVHTPARARELLTITTWCSGTGSRWAERRTTLRGEHGAHVEAAAIWVHVDATTGRPVPWGEDFASLYLESAQGRTVEAKLRHPKVAPDDAETSDWAFRQTDLDAFGHVNNAAYLSIAEEHMSLDVGPNRIEIEWRAPSMANEPLRVFWADADGDCRLWVLAVADDSLRVTMRQTSLKG